MTQIIVTKQTIENLLANERTRVDTIGRALIVLYQRQTAAEQSAKTTRITNNEGFTQADARSGTLTALSYMKNKTLADWQINKWLRPNRLAKYHRQLNEAAIEKANRN